MDAPGLRPGHAPPASQSPCRRRHRCRTFSPAAGGWRGLLLATVVHAAALEAAAAAATRGRNPAGYLPAQRSRDALARSLTFFLCRVQRKAHTCSLLRGRRPCGGGETAWLPLVGNVGGYQIARRERGRCGSGPTFVFQCVRAHVFLNRVTRPCPYPCHLPGRPFRRNRRNALARGGGFGLPVAATSAAVEAAA